MKRNFFPLIVLSCFCASLLAAPTTKPTSEIVFKVGKLECCLVNGVGCGHLLAPTLAKIDAIEGVSHSYSNWTGTLLRISTSRAADRETVAERVRVVLATDQFEPVRLDGKQLAEALAGEEWRGVDRIAELTSYEFKTVAKRRATAFADEQKLDQEKRDKLLALVDQVWDKAAEGLGQPKPDAAAYAAYWKERCDIVVKMYLERASELLSAEQVAAMAREYADRPK